MEEEEKKMSAKEFWIRFGIWLAFAFLVPVIYIFIAFGIFKNVDTGTKLSGWGVIGVIFTCTMLTIVISDAKKGLTYGNMFRQCVDGYSVLIWLIGFIFLIDKIKNNAQQFENFLIVVLISEAIAVPINPLRKWAEEHNIERGENFWRRTIRRALGKDD